MKCAEKIGPSKDGEKGEVFEAPSLIKAAKKGEESKLRGSATGSRRKTTSYAFRCQACACGWSEKTAKKKNSDPRVRMGCYVASHPGRDLSGEAGERSGCGAHAVLGLATATEWPRSQ